MARMAGLVQGSLEREAGPLYEDDVPEAIKAVFGEARTFEWVDEHYSVILVEFTQAEWRDLERSGYVERVGGGFRFTAEMP